MFEVLSEGDCSQLVVHIGLAADPDPTIQRVVDWSINPNCTVTFGPVQRLVVPAPAGEASDGGVASLRATCPNPYNYWYNYHHSWQQFDDVINIKVAELEAVNRRYWEGYCPPWVWYQYDGYAPHGLVEAVTAKSWNHPTVAEFQEFGSGCHYYGPCGNAEAAAHGHFHSDFLWCNFSTATQEMDLYNLNWDYNNGGYYTDFWSRVPCGGLHARTAVWVNMDPNIVHE